MIRPIALRHAANPTIRHAIRLLGMVHELHKAGYQRLRISPGMAPSGMYWRCSITHAGNMADDGYSIRSSPAAGEVAHYTSADNDGYYRWEDARGLSARELAARFIVRFPILSERGAGRDWPYAGWFTEMLGRVEAEEAKGLPVFFADYPLEIDPELLPPRLPAEG